MFSKKPLRIIVAGYYLCISSVNLLCAHDDDKTHTHVRAVKPAEMYQPSPIPDRIILTWAGDPKTTQAVTWRTSVEVADAYAELAIAGGGPDFAVLSETYRAKSTALKTDLNTAHFHSVEFKGLKPGTKYAYRVGDKTNWSEWFHFSTEKDSPEPFSFIYFGDAQNDLRSMWSRVIREAHSDAPKAKFIIHAGDLVNTAQSDGEWGEWFGAGSWLNAMIPSVPSVGNHEMQKGDDGKSRLSHHWRPQFTLPQQNCPEGLEETCYTLEYQDTLIVSMNSNEKLEQQVEWLDNVLGKNKQKWVICNFHHPIFSTAKDRDNAKLRSLWKPVLDKYRVDLVLQGHDHTYGRTGLDTPVAIPETVGNVPTGVNKVDMFTGTVYVVSVSGPKMYNLSPSTLMQRVAEDTQLYQVIRVDGDKLFYESRTAIGDLYDGFVLEKQPGKPNRMTEVAPDVPERRRQSKEPKAAVNAVPANAATPAAVAK
ncbi:MAG: metallophosphoesterase family protein [Planctomycetota bacterium]|nr:metallophosphoesterase family protein [Planctomycetota bacterium]